MTKERVTALLSEVVDPVLQKNLVDAKMVKDVQVEAKRVRIQLELPTPAWEPKALLTQEIQRVVGAAAGERAVELAFGADVKPVRPIGADNLMPQVRNVILFASGKGGVGKSTVAVNVATALANMGAKVGLLDSDIYGPSIPTMMGTHERPQVTGQKLVPVAQHGLKLMSIGFIVDPSEAMTWRGPMLNGALIQFMRDVEWGDLDYLILDLPPGTGDVQLTISQNVKVAGAVLVSTPQDVAIADVTRGKAMFDKVGINTLGVVENMAYFICDGCSKKHHIFADGGASRIAKEMKVPVLGEVPLEVSTRESADAGKPEVLSHPESEASKAFFSIARRVATELAVQASKVTAKPSGLKIIQ
ncbi:MAG: iron-sulfur cluster carrier protein ApbC [Myxococcales bacterium]|nr:iron-sulfur cluster carrier protein ApbC [Myxococcales bacterium]MCB9648730.1 iron-sulfur cluster carrier protein ApbC [Deltaproteobacteria bacterium]